MEAFGACAGAAVMSDDPAGKMAECDEKYDVTVCDSACGCKLFNLRLFASLVLLHPYTATSSTISPCVTHSLLSCHVLLFPSHVLLHPPTPTSSTIFVPCNFPQTVLRPTETDQSQIYPKILLCFDSHLLVNISRCSSQHLSHAV